ncbi:MAG: TetR/AcrR family transcriptional regulator [Paracoccaceae bacterium]
METASPQTRKAGRPLSFDRDAALRQAMLAFWAHGYEATSISDLTAAMGVTAPSIYTAFGDKKRLFLEAARLYAGAPEDLQAALDKAPTARDAAQDMLRNAAVAFTRPDTPRGCLLASGTASVSDAAMDVQRAVSQIRDDIRQRLTLRIARDISAGLCAATPPAETRAAMIVALIQGMSVLARDGVGRDGLLAMADCAMTGWPPGNQS